MLHRVRPNRGGPKAKKVAAPGGEAGGGRGNASRAGSGGDLERTASRTQLSLIREAGRRRQTEWRVWTKTTGLRGHWPKLQPHAASTAGRMRSGPRPSESAGLTELFSSSVSQWKPVTTVRADCEFAIAFRVPPPPVPVPPPSPPPRRLKRRCGGRHFFHGRRVDRNGTPTRSTSNRKPSRQRRPTAAIRILLLGGHASSNSGNPLNAKHECKNLNLLAANIGHIV